MSTGNIKFTDSISGETFQLGEEIVYNDAEVPEVNIDAITVVPRLGHDGRIEFVDLYGQERWYAHPDENGVVDAFILKNH